MTQYSWTSGPGRYNAPDETPPMDGITRQPPPDEDGPRLEIDLPADQRRWTVGLRFLLLIPSAIVVALLGLAATLMTIPGWFAAVVTGRLPSWVRTFQCEYLRVLARVSAYQMLLTDRYPPLDMADPRMDYPVRLVLPAPGRLNRASVLFRGLLMVPAALLYTVLNQGWSLVSGAIWAWTLITGRTPMGPATATMALLRFTLHTQAWALMVTSRYPGRLFGERGTEAPPAATGRGVLRLSRAGTVWLVVFLLAGVAYWAIDIGSIVAGSRPVLPTHAAVGGPAGLTPAHHALLWTSQTTHVLGELASADVPFDGLTRSWSITNLISD